MIQDRKLEKVRKDWTTLSHEDPLWAILSVPEKDRGRWDVEEFFATGNETIAQYVDILNSAQFSGPWPKILDFGCGAGRLTRAWEPLCSTAVGVDISDKMIELAEKFNSGRDKLQFRENPRSDLQFFADEEFDLVFSHICLQHIPYSLTKNYLAEFSRVCKRGGLVVFQLPERPPQSQFFARVRKTLVELLPFGLAQAYRKRKYHRTVLFDMNFTPREKVERDAVSSGLRLVSFVPMSEAGELQGAIYVFQRS